MDLQMGSGTVLLLGPGDELDRAILRAVAVEGGATYATRAEHSRPHPVHEGLSASHWSSAEGHIDAAVVRRIRRFLDERRKSPTAVIFHIDTLDDLAARGPLRRWRFRTRARSMIRSMLPTLLAAANADGPCQLILLYALTDDRERSAASAWLERAMTVLLKRAPAGVRVNAVLVAPGMAGQDTASVVAFLAAPMSLRISGALIPIDDGILAREYARSLPDTSDAL